MEVLNRENPTWITKKATINAAIYSIRPWPKGCSSSAGFSAIFTPTMLTMEEAASDKLLNASAITEILLAMSPVAIFTTNSSRLQQIPTIPDSSP